MIIFVNVFGFKKGCQYMIKIVLIFTLCFFFCCFFFLLLSYTYFVGQLALKISQKYMPQIVKMISFYYTYK
jgi:hypothetical protein